MKKPTIMDVSDTLWMNCKVIPELTELHNQLDDAARRAYRSVVETVSHFDNITTGDIDAVMRAMNETIGDYHE